MNRTILSLAFFAGAIGLVTPATLVRADNPVRLLAEKEEEHKGEKKDLGAKEVAGYTIKVTQIGDLKAGTEGVFILVVTGGTAKPKAIRTWVGIESAEGSTKAKAEDEDKEWHAHTEVPKPIPAKSQFWVEVEGADGKKKVAYDMK